MNMSLEQTVSDLLKRLESTTSRLESVEKALAEASKGGVATGGASSGASAGSSAAAVKEFQNLVDSHIVNFVALSKKLAPELGKQADELVKAIEAEKQVISIASQSKKPTSQDVLMKVIAPVNAAAQQVGAIRESVPRSHKMFNHLSAISESIGFLSWVVVEPTPGPHVVEMRSSSEFYTNRILKDHKGDQDQTEWVNSYIGFLKDLEKYIKQYHTTGLTWNPKGGDAAAATPAASTPASAPTPSAGGPPLPPPPPPPLTAEELNRGGAAGKGDMSGVFGAISSGNVTAGLKKVTKDMKTSNMKDKSSVVKATDKPVTKGNEFNKPAKFALEGNKWCVEYQVSNKSVIIDAPETKHTVYIYSCLDTVVQVKGKVNSIVMDKCKKTAVVFDSVISSCEFVNCESVEVQVTGKVPSIAIDKTSNIQLYLSKSSLDAEVVSSKSSDMNILIPGASENDDMIELSVPQQFRTLVKGKALETEAVSHI